MMDIQPSNWFLLAVFLELSITQKSIAQFLLRLGLASYLCCDLLHTFITTKMHPSDVEPSYILIFRLIQSAVYPVGVSKDCSCFMKKSIITLRILHGFSLKLVPMITFGCFTSVPNFNQIGVWVCELEWFFQVSKIQRIREKSKEKTQKFSQKKFAWFSSNSASIVSLGRQAPPQQIWHQLDEILRSYKCCDFFHSY